MKRIFSAITLIIVMLCTLLACGESNGEVNGPVGEAYADECITKMKGEERVNFSSALAVSASAVYLKLILEEERKQTAYLKDIEWFVSHR